MSIILGSLWIIATTIVIWLDLTMSANPTPLRIAAIGYTFGALLISSHFIGW